MHCRNSDQCSLTHLLKTVTEVREIPGQPLSRMSPTQALTLIGILCIFKTLLILNTQHTKPNSNTPGLKKPQTLPNSQILTNCKKKKKKIIEKHVDKRVSRKKGWYRWPLEILQSRFKINQVSV